MYTQKEVVQLLVNNNNYIMKLLGESKYFVIEKEEVVTYRRTLFLKDRELSRYSFDYIIKEAKDNK